jgi:hypothetical protein
MNVSRKNALYGIRMEDTERSARPFVAHCGDVARRVSMGRNDRLRGGGGGQLDSGSLHIAAGDAHRRIPGGEWMCPA